MPDRNLVNTARITLLPLIDSALFNLSFWIAYAGLYLCGYPVHWETYGEVALYAWLVPPAVFYFSGLYRSWDEYAFAKGINGILSGVAGSLLVLLVLIWFIRERLLQACPTDVTNVQELVWGFPTRVLLVVMVLAPILIWLWRILANRLERSLVGLSARPRRVLIAGNMPLSDIERLAASRRPAYCLVGRLAAPGDDHGQAADLPCLGTASDIETVLACTRIDEVFVMAPDFSQDRMLMIISACFAANVRVRLVIGVYEALIAATTSHLQGELPLCRFRGAGISGWNLVIKRLIDVTVSMIALAFSIPFLILPACIAIVIESKGWPVFSQMRMGQNGLPFKVYKLRTMVIDAPYTGTPLTQDNDPRITRVGRFLRKTSIDELPQLWNVFKGDMSLVGPRAVIPYVADQFQDWERLSLSVKPGITGLAQVSGRDEIGFREKSLLNLYYVRNHSIWLDLRIIFDTFGVVLSMEGTGGTKVK